MKLADVLAITIPITGLYPTLDNLELDEPAIIPIVKSALSFFGKYHPLVTDQHIMVPSGVYHYTFGLIPDEKIPKWVSDATYVVDINNAIIALGLVKARTSDLEPVHMPWRYQSPTLYFPASGGYTVKACFDRIYSIDTDDVPVVETEELFFNLLAARIMIAVGRTRRSILFNNSEFTVDYGDMVNDGTQKEIDTKQEIIDNTNFGLAWG